MAPDLTLRRELLDAALALVAAGRAEADQALPLATSWHAWLIDGAAPIRLRLRAQAPAEAAHDEDAPEPDIPALRQMLDQAATAAAAGAPEPEPAPEPGKLDAPPRRRGSIWAHLTAESIAQAIEVTHVRTGEGVSAAQIASALGERLTVAFRFQFRKRVGVLLSRGRIGRTGTGPHTLYWPANTVPQPKAPDPQVRAPAPKPPLAEGERRCLTCGETFKSAGPGNRLCEGCRGRRDGLPDQFVGH